MFLKRSRLRVILVSWTDKIRFKESLYDFYYDQFNEFVVQICFPVFKVINAKLLFIELWVESTAFTRWNDSERLPRMSVTQLVPFVLLEFQQIQRSVSFQKMRMLMIFYATMRLKNLMKARQSPESTSKFW